MKVIAQSEAPTSLSYVHLAYISVRLQNRISKGELFPIQTMLGIALATAIACGAIAGKLSQAGRRARGIKWAAAGGFVATLVILWNVEAAWSERRANNEVVDYVIKTRQFWALRDPKLAPGIEAAASTNGEAAAMAAMYYGLKPYSDENPERAVKGYRFAERAAALGYPSHWLPALDYTNYWPSELEKKAFEAALKSGKLTADEQIWTKEQLARMAAIVPEEKQSDGKH